MTVFFDVLLVCTVEFGLTNPKKKKKCLVYEERIDGRDPAKDKKKKALIKCVPMESCGEDNLLSSSQTAQLPDCYRMYRLHTNNSIK